ncbi:MAG TPA: hypothetical protein VI259_02655, partial [Gemmatimonadaceae bacterium]
MNTAMSPDYDGSGYDRRPAMTGAEAEIRTLIGVVLNQAFITVERAETGDSSFRPGARRACLAARRHGLLVEHLLLMVKRAWAEEWPRRVLRRQQAAFALERVVTVCIQEFYSSDNDES